MNRVWTSMVVTGLLLLLVPSVQAKEKRIKAGPLTGTWDCTSHGGPQGDLPFTLTLQQTKDIVTGSVASPIGDTDITSASLKKDVLEIHIDTPQGNYLLTAKYKKNALVEGEWSTDSQQKGTWEGKREAAKSQ